MIFGTEKNHSLRSRNHSKGENFMEFDKQGLPKHVAIIMDGNRRWAKERGKPANFGHKAGAHFQLKIGKEQKKK